MVVCDIFFFFFFFGWGVGEVEGRAEERGRCDCLAIVHLVIIRLTVMALVLEGYGKMQLNGLVNHRDSKFINQANKGRQYSERVGEGGGDNDNNNN